MPITKPQNLKALSTISLQPDKMSSKIQLIIALDISGSNGKEIARQTGLSENRISIIRNSPLYMSQRELKWQQLQNQVLSKKSNAIVAGDPVKQKIKSLAIEAANEYESLLHSSKSDFVRKSAADAILDRAGYRPKTEQTRVSIEVTDKMAQRFEKVLKMSVTQDSNV